MKSKITIVALFLSLLWQGLSAQIPLVYNQENTAAACTHPPLPFFHELPVVEPLPDPFMWSNGLGRSTNFADWKCRRNEIKAEIENYEIGTKPSRPDTITASYAPGTNGGVLTVVVVKNGETLTLTSQISLPAGSGPFPAIIGMNSPSGSIPADIFTSRNIARITYSHNQVTTYANPQITNPFYRLYPDQNLENSGQYAAWAWGVSRLIDGLELVQAQLPIDLSHIGVTGCSYAGKMALFAGALDERIALTIAQESGGGGAPAWRVSETIGGVENLGATDYRWFRDSMRQFAAANVSKLPHDHHELMAMIAPRALLVTGNTDFEWLANPSAYVSARAAHEVWKTFGVGDRFGFYIDGGHNHCAIPNTQRPAVEAFVEKFLLGNTNVATDITVHPYPNLDYKRWYQWWGTDSPILPPPPPPPLGKRIWMEAECATVGSNWQVVEDTAASNGRYVTANSGLEFPTSAPKDAASAVVFPFMVDSAGTYNVVARLNAPAGSDYNYWVKVDGGAFTNISSQLLVNNGFENGLSGWSIFNTSGATIAANPVASEARTGNGSLKVINRTANPGGQWRVQLSSSAFPTTIGKQYEISYWVKAASPGGSIRLSTGPSSAQYQADQQIGTSWQKITWTITASLASTTFLFDMGLVANTYYIDDASVKEIGADGWRWVKLREAELGVGPHTLTIALNEDVSKLDKVIVTTSNATFTGKGDAANNCNTPPCASGSNPTFLNNSQIVLDASCGANDGNISIIPQSGTAPFMYSIDGGATYVEGGDAGYTFTGLGVGTYQLRLKDAFGCESEVIEREVKSVYGGISFLNNSSIVLDASCGKSDGNISIIPTSGTAPFMYSIDGGANWVAGPAAGYTFQNLAPGTYSLMLKDATGCVSPAVQKEVKALYNCPTPAGVNSLFGVVTDGANGLAKEQVITYPNPTRGQFRVQLQNFVSPKAEVSVFDAKGTLVEKTQVNVLQNNFVNFDLSGKSKGLYMVKIVTNTGTKTSKIVLQ